MNYCMLQNSEISTCQPATLPAGLLSYGAKCDPNGEEICEVGSTCARFSDDLAICYPEDQIKGSSGHSAGFIVGMFFLALFLLVACVGTPPSLVQCM